MELEAGAAFAIKHPDEALSGVGGIPRDFARPSAAPSLSSFGGVLMHHDSVPSPFPPGYNRGMHLDSSHLVAYAELVGSLQDEKPSAVLERMQSQIEAGDLDLKDVFVALDRTGVEVTDIVRLVRIGKDEAFLTQWRGRGSGTRHTIAALLTEARAG